MTLATASVFAESVKLIKVPSVPIPDSTLPGYEFESDQIFKISGGVLKGKYILFARKQIGAPAEMIARIVISDDKKIISSANLPNMLEDWNIVQTQAIGLGQPKKQMARSDYWLCY